LGRGGENHVFDARQTVVVRRHDPGGAIQDVPDGGRHVDAVAFQNGGCVGGGAGLSHGRTGADHGRIVAGHIRDHQRQHSRRMRGCGQLTALHPTEMLANGVHLPDRRA